MRINSEAIGTISVFLNRSYLELYHVLEEEDDDDDDDDDIWDWADSSVLSLKAHRIVTWNQHQTDLSVAVRLR